MQQIDEMLAGSLSPEDEDAVLAELEAITQVPLLSISPASAAGSRRSNSQLAVLLLLLRETLSFPTFLQTSCQKSQNPQRKEQVCWSPGQHPADEIISYISFYFVFLALMENINIVN